MNIKIYVFNLSLFRNLENPRERLTQKTYYRRYLNIK